MARGLCRYSLAMTRPILALDADGVLVDLHIGYARAWQRAFGVTLAERDPLAYWPTDRWDVSHSMPKSVCCCARSSTARCGSLPAIDGAVEACHRLHDAGYELVCVTALEARFQAARLRNLKALGFPIRRVVATGHVEGERSPKADAIAGAAAGGLRRRLHRLHARHADRGAYRAGAARAQRQPEHRRRTEAGAFGAPGPGRIRRPLARPHDPTECITAAPCPPLVDVLPAAYAPIIGAWAGAGPAGRRARDLRRTFRG